MTFDQLFVAIPLFGLFFAGLWLASKDVPMSLKFAAIFTVAGMIVAGV